MKTSTTICWRFPTSPRKTVSVHRCFSTTSHSLVDNNLLKWRQENPELVVQTQARVSHYKRDNLLLRMTGKKLSRAFRRTDEDRPFYSFALGYSEFGLPSELASRWEFENIAAEDRLFKLIMDVTDGPHNHVWAQKSIETDDAQRLGIAVCYAAHEPVWLTNVNPSAVAAANTCVDILTGKISTTEIGNHRWSSDRDPFLGPWGPYISRKSWDDVFRNTDRRRDALRKGEPLKPSWKPKRFYLKNYNAIMGYCGLEQDSKPPACIDPLTAPAPPHPTQLRSYLLRTRSKQFSPENARGLL